MITITCPKCGTDSKLSLVQPVYQGPHKCWKCRELFTIRIENNVVTFCGELSQEEFDEQRQAAVRQQEFEDLKARFKKFD